MKRIMLFRHAKADYDAPDDFDRRLTENGRSAARLMGRAMHEDGLRFDLILSSPASRTTETLAEAGKGFGAQLTPRLLPDLYLATPATLLKIVQGLEDEANLVLIAGHNPGLEQFALLLAAPNDPGAEKVKLGFKTAAYALIALPADHWVDVEESTATVEKFVTRRDVEGRAQ